MKGFTPILLLLLSVGIFYLYLDPKYAAVQVLEAKQERYEEAVNKSREIQVLRDQLLTKYNSFDKTDLERLEKMLPDNVDNVRLIMDIDSMAQNYNIEINNLEIEEGGSDSAAIASNPASGAYNSITLGFGFESNYDNFVAFTKDLERSLRLVDMSTVELKTGEDNIYDYRVTLKTYWLK